eukprot:1155931_1
MALNIQPTVHNNQLQPMAVAANASNMPLNNPRTVHNMYNQLQPMTGAANAPNMPLNIQPQQSVATNTTYSTATTAPCLQQSVAIHRGRRKRIQYHNQSTDTCTTFTHHPQQPVPTNTTYSTATTHCPQQSVATNTTYSTATTATTHCPQQLECALQSK